MRRFVEEQKIRVMSRPDKSDKMKEMNEEWNGKEMKEVRSSERIRSASDLPPFRPSPTKPKTRMQKDTFERDNKTRPEQSIEERANR